MLDITETICIIDVAYVYIVSSVNLLSGFLGLLIMYKFKLCRLMLCLAAVAVVLTAATFSVSYAKWQAGEQVLSASVNTGAWTVNEFSNMTETDVKQKLTEALGEGKTGLVTNTGRVIGFGENNTLPRGEENALNITLAPGEQFVIFYGDKIIAATDGIHTGGRYGIWSSGADVEIQGLSGGRKAAVTNIGNETITVKIYLNRWVEQIQVDQA